MFYSPCPLQKYQELVLTKIDIGNHLTKEHSKFWCPRLFWKGFLEKAVGQLKHRTFTISHYIIPLYVISSMYLTEASRACLELDAISYTLFLDMSYLPSPSQKGLELVSTKIDITNHLTKEHSKFWCPRLLWKRLLEKATHQLKHRTFAISYYIIPLYVISSLSFTEASRAGPHQNWYW